MADRLIGRAVVEVTSDNKKLEAGVASAKKSVDSLDKSTKTATSNMSAGFARVGESATKLQSVVSKILIPVAIFSQLAGVVALFVKAKVAAEELNKEIDGIKDRATSTTRAIRQDLAGLSDVQKEAADLSSEFLQQATDVAEKQAASLENVFAQSAQFYKQLLSGGSATTYQGKVNEAIAKGNELAAAQLEIVKAYTALKRKEAEDAAKANPNPLFDFNTIMQETATVGAELDKIGTNVKSNFVAAKKDASAMTAEIERQAEAYQKQLDTIREIQQIQQDITGQGFGAFGEVGAKLTGIERELAAMSSAFRAGRSGR